MVPRFSNRAVIDVVVEEVDPTASEWVLEIEVDVPIDDPRVLVLVELISVTGTMETVEWSGISDPVTLSSGQVIRVGPVAVLRGPPDNLAVTSVTIIDPGPLLEGTGVQLTADVQTEQAGLQPVLHWASADPTIATITTDGFLQALLPGTARISTVAGAHDDDVDVSVLPRATGLSFKSQPQGVDVGVPLDPAPAVEILDARGARVRTFSDPVAIELHETSGVDPSGQAGAPHGETSPQAAAGLGGSTTVVAQDGIAAFHVALQETDIEVGKSVDQHVARPGDEVVFTVSVTNNGPNDALDVVAFDQLPAGLHLVSADESHGSHDPVTGRWDVGTLDVGEHATLSLVATVDEGTEGTTLVNTASAEVLVHQNDRTDNNEATATVEVRDGEADLEVMKVVDRSTAHVGESVVYTITVKNRGPDVSTGAVLFEILPLELEVPSFDVSQGTLDEETEGGGWAIGRLEPGETAILTAVATIGSFAADTDVINSVVVVAGEGETDPVTGNNVSEAFLYVPTGAAPVAPPPPSREPEP